MSTTYEAEVTKRYPKINTPERMEAFQNGAILSTHSFWRYGTNSIRGYVDNELMFALTPQGIEEMDLDFEGLLQFTSPLWAEGTVYVPYTVSRVGNYRIVIIEPIRGTPILNQNVTGKIQSDNKLPVCDRPSIMAQSPCSLNLLLSDASGNPLPLEGKACITDDGTVKLTVVRLTDVTAGSTTLKDVVYLSDSLVYPASATAPAGGVGTRGGLTMVYHVPSEAQKVYIGNLLKYSGKE
eukprot:m51a1_g10599 hypothetical protein (238) ;mRNA; f:33669-34382